MVNEALLTAQKALLIVPADRDEFQQASVMLAMEVHRLNVLIDELHAQRTPEATTTHGD